MPQPSISPLQAAQAKQQAARRKLQQLPQQPTRAALPDTINGHDHYMKRVTK